MATFNPELVDLMRAALEEVMMRVPAEYATPTIKAHLAEIILKAAAQGETSYDGLITAGRKPDPDRGLSADLEPRPGDGAASNDRLRRLLGAVSWGDLRSSFAESSICGYNPDSPEAIMESYHGEEGKEGEEGQEEEGEEEVELERAMLPKRPRPKARASFYLCDLVRAYGRRRRRPLCTLLPSDRLLHNARMRALIILLIASLPGIAMANDLPKSGQPKNSQPKKASPVAGNPCAQYGAGFVQVPGTATCVRATGSIQIDAGRSGPAR